MDLTDIRNKYGSCKKCINCRTDTKVFGCGNLTAKIAIVGEGPGSEEEAKLTPFVGPAGQLLDKILAAIDLKREDLFFTNSVLCRTDDRNRTPVISEIQNCRDRLFEELSIVKPRYTLLVGGTALNTVMTGGYKIMEAHGQWYTHLSPPCYFYYAIPHPSWILHSVTEQEKQAKKRVMWNDIKKFKADMELFDKSISFDKRENK
jgi:uracil-DNA glycosylase